MNRYSSCNTPKIRRIIEKYTSSLEGNEIFTRFYVDFKENSITINYDEYEEKSFGCFYIENVTKEDINELLSLIPERFIECSNVKTRNTKKKVSKPVRKTKKKYILLKNTTGYYGESTEIIASDFEDYIKDISFEDIIKIVPTKRNIKVEICGEKEVIEVYDGLVVYYFNEKDLIKVVNYFKEFLGI